MFRRNWWVLRSEEGGDGGAGSGGGDSGAGAGAGDGAGAGSQGAAGGDGSAGAGMGADGKGAGEGQGDQGAKGGKDGQGQGDPSKGYWPDDWLSRVTKGDEKLAKQLGRYASPEAMAEALVAAQARIRSGELKAPLPKDATPEQISQWRKENGIPETPDGYNTIFDSEFKVPDVDRPVIDGYLKSAHAKNMSPDNVKANIEWYYAEAKRQTDVRLEKDAEERQATEETLREEWGGNYKRNTNIVAGFIDKLPESVRDAFKSARLPDGTGIFNHPDMMRGFAALAMEVDPAGTLTPGGSGDPAKNVDSEIEEIEKFMKTNRNEYNKDEKKQSRLRELYAAREKLKARAA